MPSIVIEAEELYDELDYRIKQLRRTYSQVMFVNKQEMVRIGVFINTLVDLALKLKVAIMDVLRSRAKDVSFLHKLKMIIAKIEEELVNGQVR